MSMCNGPEQHAKMFRRICYLDSTESGNERTEPFLHLIDWDILPQRYQHRLPWIYPQGGRLVPSAEDRPNTGEVVPKPPEEQGQVVGEGEPLNL